MEMDYQTITDHMDDTVIPDDTRLIPMHTWDDVLLSACSQHHLSSDLRQNIIALEGSKYPITEHTSTFFEIIYVLSGTCCHQINRNTERMDTAGDLCILPPAARHSIYTSDNSRLVHILIRPAAFMDIIPDTLSGQDSLGSFLKRSIYQNRGESYLLFHTQHEKEVHHTILNILKEMSDADEYTDSIVSGMLLTLFGRLLRTHKDFVKSSPWDPRINEILSMIYEQYSTITLSSLAEHLHYTVPYCSKYLKQHLGSTFSELIRQIRFQKAERMLTNSGMTITRIGKELGYENLENFVRAFKHQYQMTPSQYRLSNSPKLPPVENSAPADQRRFTDAS